ncbi:MAG: 50S ribosomal protein L21 [Oscillospiraceae bacterium]|jgi:large subunit ribosomal protein L21|nr:50S ribosomal protein L21 [Oscillospiraceae bacterium]
MHAIIETGGKQYRVQEGDVLFIERLPVEEGAEVVFDRVLAVFTDDDVKLGAPVLPDVKVKGTVLKHGKDKKILVFKMKAKKTYRRRQGHRQPYTKVEIGKIEA